MNITSDVIYWVGVADQIRSAFLFGTLFFLILAGICFAVGGESGQESDKLRKKIKKLELDQLDDSKKLEDEEYKKRIAKLESTMESSRSTSSTALICSIVFIIAAISCYTARVFIADSRTKAAMLVIPAVVNNADVQKVSKNVLELTDDFLRGILAREINNCSSCKK